MWPDDTIPSINVSTAQPCFHFGTAQSLLLAVPLTPPMAHVKLSPLAITLAVRIRILDVSGAFSN